MPRQLILAAAILAVTWQPIAAPASAQTQPSVERTVPIERADVLILVRSAMTALDQANKTGNYTVLRDLGGPTFQHNTATRLAEAFAYMRTDQIDLASALALDPVLAGPPRLDAQGRLRLAGMFPTNPRQLTFEIAYENADGLWRLYGLSVSAGPPTPSPTTPVPQ